MPSPVEYSDFRTPAALAVAMLLAMPGQGQAQGQEGNYCVQDFQPGAVCTANDVRIERLNVVSILEDCESGTPGEAEVVMEVLVSADGSPDRYDIGIYLAQDGGSALSGDMCYHDYLDPPLTASPIYADKNSDTVQDLTDGPWWDGGADGDSCGDIQSNTQLFKTLPALRFSCVDNNGDGSADVDVATSWDNNTNTACNTVEDAFAGTNSKCSSAPVELNIPPSPEISVAKDPADQIVEDGGDAEFTITVTGRTHLSNVVVDDPQCTSLTGPLGDADDNDILTPGETWTYTCTVADVTADFTNTVTATADAPPAIGQVQDSASADVAVERPAIGVAKAVTALRDLGGGDYEVDFSLVVENLGNVALQDVQVSDDLGAALPAPITFNVESGPAASGSLTANAGFDGSGDSNLLDAGVSSLAPGAVEAISFTVRLSLNGAAGPFVNTAIATGTSVLDTPTRDTSDDGTDPDPNGDGDAGDPGEDDPTPMVFGEPPPPGPGPGPAPPPPPADSPLPGTVAPVPLMPAWSLVLVSAALVVTGVWFRRGRR